MEAESHLDAESGEALLNVRPGSELAEAHGAAKRGLDGEEVGEGLVGEAARLTFFEFFSKF